MSFAGREPLTVELLYQRLEERGCEPKRSGAGWQAKCPCHGDTKTRHLYFKQGELRTVVLYCFKGCAFEAILHSLGFEKDHFRLRQSAGTDGKLITWSYRDAEDRLLYQECRREIMVEGEWKKSYFQRSWDEKSRRWNNGAGAMQGVVLVPYRLPELLRANPALVVCLTEGPKCAEYVARCGLPVTTTAGGAGRAKATPSLPGYLAGRKVAIFPDYDKPGVAHAKETRAWLREYGVLAEIVRIPGFQVADSHGDDIADWMARDLHTAAEVRALAEGVVANVAGTMAPLETGERREAPVAMDEAAFYGLAGEIVAHLSSSSESCLAAILVSFLIGWGVGLGRGHHTRVGHTKHWLNEFTMLVGPTGGGKGSSWSPVAKLLSDVDGAFGEEGVLTDLSSGEGIVAAVRDPVVRTVTEKGHKAGKLFENTKEVVDDEGVGDKRKLFLLSEFGTVLAVARRQGNTLTGRLKEAWDSGRLEIGTKERMRATNAHIGMITHITPEELMARLSEEEASSGFGNRFLLVWTMRRQLLPHGGKLRPLADLVHVLHLLKDQVAVDLLQRDREANWMWEGIYQDLTRPKRGLFGKMIGRRQAHVLRLSALYATLENATMIRPPHLLAALAVWEYCERTAWFLFGRRTGIDVADRIYTELLRRPAGLPKSAIAELLGGGFPAETLFRSLMMLTETGRIYSERQVGHGGREVEMYFAIPERESEEPQYLAKATRRYEEGAPEGWEPSEVLEMEAE